LKSKFTLIILAVFGCYNCTSVQQASIGTIAGGAILLGGTATPTADLIFSNNPDPNVQIAGAVTALAGLAIFVTSVAAYTNIDSNHSSALVAIRSNANTPPWPRLSTVEEETDQTVHFDGVVWNFASNLIESSFVQRSTRNIAIRCNGGSIAECRHFAHMVINDLDNFDLEDGEACEFTATACEETSDSQICALSEACI